MINMEINEFVPNLGLSVRVGAAAKFFITPETAYGEEDDDDEDDEEGEYLAEGLDAGRAVGGTGCSDVEHFVGV